MRPWILFAPALIAFPLGSLMVQDPVPETGGDEEQEIPAFTGSLGSIFSEERKHLEEGVVGAWTLQLYEDPNAFYNQSNIQGFAIFLDGFVSMSLTAQTYAPEFLSTSGQQYFQSGTHRYRISPLLELQTASIVAFDNMEAEKVVYYEAPGTAREYSLNIDEEGKTLKMTRRDGVALTWSRMLQTGFPEVAIDRLNLGRSRYGSDR